MRAAERIGQRGVLDISKIFPIFFPRQAREQPRGSGGDACDDKRTGGGKGGESRHHPAGKFDDNVGGSICLVCCVKHGARITWSFQNLKPPKTHDGTNHHHHHTQAKHCRTSTAPCRDLVLGPCPCPPCPRKKWPTGRPSEAVCRKSAPPTPCRPNSDGPCVYYHFKVL